MQQRSERCGEYAGYQLVRPSGFPPVPQRILNHETADASPCVQYGQDKEASNMMAKWYQIARTASAETAREDLRQCPRRRLAPPSVVKGLSPTEWPKQAISGKRNRKSPVGNRETAVLALAYHFAIMFEALFILTVLDAGTRVAFHGSGCAGHWWKPLVAPVGIPAYSPPAL